MLIGASPENSASMNKASPPFAEVFRDHASIFLLRGRMWESRHENAYTLISPVLGEALPPTVNVFTGIPLRRLNT